MTDQYLTNIKSLKAPLSQQVNNLLDSLTQLGLVDVAFAILYGSCVRGEATYRSDIDLLFILTVPSLKYGDVVARRSHIENNLKKLGKSALLDSPLPVQFNFTTDRVFQTSDLGMKKALREGVLFMGDEDEFNRRLKETA